jgi:putative hydrolase
LSFLRRCDILCSMLADFHTHTCLSDGVLSPIELIRRAHVLGLGAIALTDHAGPGSLGRVIEEVKKDCLVARAHWNIMAIPGVELTHLPSTIIPEVAQRAKELGAWLVVVHGETLTEPVEPGTNRAALSSPYVDLLAHPGLITLDEALLAARQGIFLELSTRKGHCLTNGHIAQMARRTQAKLLIASDAHDEGELLTPSLFRAVSIGAGLAEEELAALQENAQLLLSRLPVEENP